LFGPQLVEQPFPGDELVVDDTDEVDPAEVQVEDRSPGFGVRPRGDSEGVPGLREVRVLVEEPGGELVGDRADRVLVERAVLEPDRVALLVRGQAGSAWPYT